MPTETKVLIPIADALRFVLYGISVLLEVDMRASEVERLFAVNDTGNHSVGEYEFHRSSHAIVTGIVEEYEPETVWLSVEAKRMDQQTLERLVETAKHSSYHLPSIRRTM